MRVTLLVAALLPLMAYAVNIIQSNDDGWAEINIRVLYSSLTDAGFKSFISAPAENQSGSGSSEGEPTKVDGSGCEFSSCPPNSPPTGKNDSMPKFHYVNSYPATAIEYGIEKTSPKIFGKAPALAVTGFNVGSNLGLVTLVSGTVGAATKAASMGIPAIAFSGSTGSQTAWNAAVETYMKVYSDLSTNVTQVLTDSGKPYLPDNIWLNVNFPEVGDNECTSPSDFKFVLSRIHTAVPFISGDDVETCNNDQRLPTESKVVGTDGCYASISVGKADNKRDASASNQKIVLDKLKSILSCLPD